MSAQEKIIPLAKMRDEVNAARDEELKAAEARISTDLLNKMLENHAVALGMLRDAMSDVTPAQRKMLGAGLARIHCQASGVVTAIQKLYGSHVKPPLLLGDGTIIPSDGSWAANNPSP